MDAATQIVKIDPRLIWRSISAAVGADLREATTILGASGQNHPVQAIAVDDKSKRVIVFSAEASPRIAALMQADVQATLNDAHVLVARPVIFDLSTILRRAMGGSDRDFQVLVDLFSNTAGKLGKDKQKKFNHLLQNNFGPVLKPLFETAAKVPLPFATQLFDFLEQLMSLNWEDPLTGEPSTHGIITALMSIRSMDSAEADRRLGVCPIPLYEFSDQDYELLAAGAARVDELQDRLKQMGIYQYFFPAPDQLLLGLTDKNITKDGSLA
jgi:hypothetical protein